MALERAGQRKLAEFVADHVLVDVNRNVLATVMNRNRKPNKLRQNCGAARPGFDRFLALLGDSNLDLFDQVRIDEWAFLTERDMIRPLIYACGVGRSYCPSACCYGSCNP